MTTTSATASSRLKGIAPQFVVADVVRAAEHYRDALGFTIADYFGDPPVFAIVSRDGVEIHLGKRDTGNIVPNRTVRGDGLDAYIWVEDLDALAHELQARGASILEGPVTRIYGMRELIVEDDNGYRLAFGESAAP